MASTWRSNWCLEVKPLPGILVIFGASGDLAKRKLYPALEQLHRNGLWPEESHVIGCARRDYTDVAYRAEVRGSLSPEACEKCGDFLEHFHFLSGDYRELELYRALAARIAELEEGAPPEWPLHVTLYLATPPEVYTDIIPQLSAAGLLAEEAGSGWRHVVFEKPFGRDLESARTLDAMLKEYLQEPQIYRIDHYLGKDTVQNILMTRFANIIFEPVWNRHYIEAVQITVAETLGVEHRAGYYERAGLLRDMFQNHLLELLTLVTMELPSGFNAEAIRNEKLKLIQSIRPFELEELDKLLVRGQYDGYREAPGVAPDSRMETYVAGKFFIDNWRWNGVPFYLRSGKKLGRKLTEIAVIFKKVPQSIFAPIKAEDLHSDVLVLKVQPEEGMSLTIQAKQPGPKLCMGELTMDFDYGRAAGEYGLDAYARLLLDAMLGDATLFIRSDVIEASWQLFSPVLHYWEQHPELTLAVYPPGSDGPEEADRLLLADGNEWRPLKKDGNDEKDTKDKKNKK